jgi:PD-(D/E)XK nuclease superfamily
MSIKLSNSGKNKYMSCPRSYQLHYIDKWRPITISSPLIFGSSIDNALNVMLDNKDNPEALKMSLHEFDRHWEQNQNSVRQIVDIPLNPNIRYSRTDFDPDLLEKKDWAELFKYNKDFFEMKNATDEKLKAGVEWLDIPEEDRMVLNYSNWLCMSRKGHLLLEAYHKDILPNFKRVIAVQKTVELLDEDGNNLNGVIDFVAELHDGRIAVVDNKTSSQEYEEDSVSGSEQLATYQEILNIFAEDPENEWTHKIDCCAYSVLVKKLEKDITKVCKDCNHLGQGSHKTCDNILDGKRCNGEWTKTKKFTVKTQFIVGEISDEFAQEVLENVTTVKSCIELGLFPKNYSNCKSMFGSPCPYLSLCHKNEPKGLIKLDNK